MVKLPRAPGAREARWAHLLCGEVAEAGTAALAGEAAAGVSAGEMAALKAEQTRMAAELANCASAGAAHGARTGRRA